MTEQASVGDRLFALFEEDEERWWLEEGATIPDAHPRDLPGCYEIADGVWVVPLPRRNERLAALTARQRQVAELAANGLTYKEISEQLGISAQTTRTHLKNIYQRLQVASRVELASLFHSK